MILGTVPKVSKSQWTHCTSLHCQSLSICPAFFAQKRPQHRCKKIRRPGSACSVFLYDVASKIWSKIQTPKSEIQNPKSPKSGQKSLDFGFRNSRFWILGGSRGCTTRQFSDGALRSEARIPPGPPTVSDRAGGRKKTRQQRREREGAKTTFVGNIFQGFCCSWA